MLIYANVQFFPALLLYWTSLDLSYKQQEEIWYLNMESIGENTTSQLLPFELRLYGPILNCGIWNTARVLVKC